MAGYLNPSVEKGGVQPGFLVNRSVLYCFLRSSPSCFLPHSTLLAVIYHDVLSIPIHQFHPVHSDTPSGVPLFVLHVVYPHFRLYLPLYTSVYIYLRVFLYLRIRNRCRDGYHPLCDDALSFGPGSNPSSGPTPLYTFRSRLWEDGGVREAPRGT